jgi:uncharacterized protein DUF664
MYTSELLTDGFERIREVTLAAISGLSAQQLGRRLAPEANSIGWLVWHLTRIQDDHIADAAGIEQVWTTKGWADRFALPFADSATGFGQSPDEVGALRVSADLLAGYFEDVHAQTTNFVTRLQDADLDRIVDDRWDPPVSLGVRLVSVISDDLQHAGQAAFVRGVIA